MKNQVVNGTINFMFVQRPLFICFHRGGYKKSEIMSGGGIMGVISIFILKAISENKSEGN